MAYSANGLVSFKTLPLINSRCCLMGIDRCCEIRSFRVAMVSVRCKLKISNWVAGFNVLIVTLMVDAAVFVVDSGWLKLSISTFKPGQQTRIRSGEFTRWALTASSLVIDNRRLFYGMYAWFTWRLSLLRAELGVVCVLPCMDKGYWDRWKYLDESFRGSTKWGVIDAISHWTWWQAAEVLCNEFRFVRYHIRLIYCCSASVQCASLTWFEDHCESDVTVACPKFEDWSQSLRDTFLLILVLPLHIHGRLISIAYCLLRWLYCCHVSIFLLVQTRYR